MKSLVSKLVAPILAGSLILSGSIHFSQLNQINNLKENLSSSRKKIKRLEKENQLIPEFEKVFKEKHLQKKVEYVPLNDKNLGFYMFHGDHSIYPNYQGRTMNFVGFFHEISKKHSLGYPIKNLVARAKIDDHAKRSSKFQFWTYIREFKSEEDMAEHFSADCSFDPKQGTLNLFAERMHIAMYDIRIYSKEGMGNFLDSLEDYCYRLKVKGMRGSSPYTVRSPEEFKERLISHKDFMRIIHNNKKRVEMNKENLHWKNPISIFRDYSN
ncbi:MAG: hypothetical protein ACOCUU_01475 [Nanoarchaeota archaeon]